MISISFYLRTPNAREQSNVYVSLVSKNERIRFATGEKFIAAYCNSRNGKGSKPLPKKSTEFYFDYTDTLEKIRNKLIRIEKDLIEKNKGYNLASIRDLYLGRIKKPTLSVYDAIDLYLAKHKSQWELGTYNINQQIKTNLERYEKEFGEISLGNLNENFWDKYRDDYFVDIKQLSNSTINVQLKKFKQFLKFAVKNEYIKHKIDFEDLEFLGEIEPFKIALKEHEVETLLTLDLSHDKQKEQVRDLFALEIFSGQRFSDIPSMLNKENINETSITIYQKKTHEKVNIPLHPRLKSHLNDIFINYPEGLPMLKSKVFNKEIKEICKLAGFNKVHSWKTKTGIKLIEHSDFRYNIIGSHTGRRTFCTLAVKEKIETELIMKVSAHKSYAQFQEYIKVDDEDVNEGFANFLVKENNK